MKVRAAKFGAGPVLRVYHGFPMLSPLIHTYNPGFRPVSPAERGGATGGSRRLQQAPHIGCLPARPASGWSRLLGSGGLPPAICAPARWAGLAEPSRLALKWDAAGRLADSLMRPADIKAAERLLERRPRTAEPPPALLGDYLDASRARIEEETRRQRRIIGRAFVKPALQSVTEGAVENALRLTAAGAVLADDLDLKLVPELWSPAAQAIFRSPSEAVRQSRPPPRADRRASACKAPLPFGDSLLFEHLARFRSKALEQDWKQQERQCG